MGPSDQTTWAGKGRINRREWLYVGGLGLVGLTLPALLGGRALASRTGKVRSRSFGKARSCIVIFLKGGPSQLDTFDMKPAAPAEVRGEFRPISTSVPGIKIGEHLPLLAQLADKYLIARSVHHQDNNHASAAYQMTTGHAYPRGLNLSGISTREDHPHLGSSVAAVEHRERAVPPFVMVPQYLVVNGEFRSGQNAGFLGGRFDPMVPGGDPSRPDFRPVDLGLASPVEAARLQHRRCLLETVNARPGALEHSVLGKEIDGFYEKAFAMLEAGLTRQALDLQTEPARVRERYGLNFFGQSVLLGRRLIEAGVRLVHVNCMSSIFGGMVNWDTHKDNFKMLKNPLLPRMDSGVSALIEDLSQRGLLEETLVVVTGEFGRTPRINEGAGRDHWANAFSVVLAGAGIPGGHVYGSTDRTGANPVEKPISAGRLAATIFHALGIEPDSQVPTLLGRPWRICEETPVLDLWS
jgi:hypothetical protein